MKAYKILITFLFAVILAAMSGCSWFDNKIPKNQNSIPGPDADIEIGADGTASKWTDSINLDNPSGATKDGWQPVKGVTFPVIYFAYDRSVVGASERYKLEQVANYLKANTQFGLIIEGHCDEHGSAEYNRALGERRAIAAKDFLANAGVSPNRLKTISYGEDRPAIKASDETGHAKNRRAELILARMQ
ncbi:MAG: OmpA family protein [Victivallales bacterium]